MTATSTTTVYDVAGHVRAKQLVDGRVVLLCLGSDCGRKLGYLEDHGPFRAVRLRSGHTEKPDGWHFSQRHERLRPDGRRRRPRVVQGIPALEPGEYPALPAIVYCPAHGEGLGLRQVIDAEHLGVDLDAQVGDFNALSTVKFHVRSHSA